MIATIETVSAAACALCCQKTDEAIEAHFNDGFKGVFCKKHFFEAVLARKGKPPAAPERREPAKGAQ